MKILHKMKAIVEKIKTYIVDWIEERDLEMKKWKEEDPDTYYEYIATHCHENC